MDHIACHLRAASSFSIQPVASRWNTKLSSPVGHSMHRAAADVVVVLCICDLFDLAGTLLFTRFFRLPWRRLYFPFITASSLSASR